MMNDQPPPFKRLVEDLIFEVGFLQKHIATCTLSIRTVHAIVETLQLCLAEQPANNNKPRS